MHYYTPHGSKSPNAMFSPPRCVAVLSTVSIIVHTISKLSYTFIAHAWMPDSVASASESSAQSAAMPHHHACNVKIASRTHTSNTLDTPLACCFCSLLCKLQVNNIFDKFEDELITKGRACSEHAPLKKRVVACTPQCIR
jgi:hypothetical protein